MDQLNVQFPQFSSAHSANDIEICQVFCLHFFGSPLVGTEIIFDAS